MPSELHVSALYAPSGSLEPASPAFLTSPTTPIISLNHGSMRPSKPLVRLRSEVAFSDWVLTCRKIAPDHVSFVIATSGAVSVSRSVKSTSPQNRNAHP
jgi:hypothetical protein